LKIGVNTSYIVRDRRKRIEQERVLGQPGLKREPLLPNTLPGRRFVLGVLGTTLLDPVAPHGFVRDEGMDRTPARVVALGELLNLRPIRPINTASTTTLRPLASCAAARCITICIMSSQNGSACRSICGGMIPTTSSSPINGRWSSRASRRASVVLPVPGKPEKMIHVRFIVSSSRTMVAAEAPADPRPKIEDGGLPRGIVQSCLRPDTPDRFLAPRELLAIRPRMALGQEGWQLLFIAALL
jgi:hypothetical protein